MANIKISQLPNINGNLTSNALMPIVSTNGTYITDKITVANLANYILGESGTTFVSGNISNLAYNVINASQPNITTVGTLTNLTVVGTTNVGYPNNFVMLGGTPGQVLATFGDGSLGWVDQVGATGAIGVDGATGATGSQGATGPEGPPGPASTIGATGATGTNGSDGATGASGPGFVWQGAWNPAGSYIGGQDVVSYAGSSYIKIGDGNSGSPPPDDPVRWSVMAEEGAVGETGATGPAGTSGIDGATGATGPQGATGAFSGIVTSNLIPDVDVAYDLGNSTNRFNDIYLSNSTIYLGDATISANGNSIVVDSITVTNGNVGTVGNIASINLDGSSSNILYGNGVFAPGGGIQSEIANGDSNVSIATAGAPVTIYNDGETWTFDGTNQSFKFPNNSNIDYAGNNLNLGAPVNGAIQFYTDNGNYYFSLDSYGYFNLPSAAGLTNSAGISSGVDLTLLSAGLHYVFGSDGNLTVPGTIKSINNVDLFAGDAVTITSNNTGTINTWQFDEAGNLTTPAYSTIKPATSSDLNIFVGDANNEAYYLTLGVDDGDGTVKSSMQFQYDQSTIRTDGENNKWIFDNAGNLTLPGNTFAVNYANGTQVPLGGGGANIGNLEITGTTIGIANGAPETSITIGGGAAAMTVDTDSGAPIINIYAQSTSSDYYAQSGGDYVTGQWAILPGGSTITLTGISAPLEATLNSLSTYSTVTITINGTDTVPYNGLSLGGGTVEILTSTNPPVDPTTVDNITFNLVFNNGLYFDPDEGDMLLRFDDNVNFTSKRDINITVEDDLRLRGNDFVALMGNNSVTIEVDAANTGISWTFNPDGTLVLANGQSVIQSIPNSSLDPLNPNVSTMVLRPDQNYSGQALVLDPTAPGHIHLRAPSYGSNIDEPVASLFLGGELSSFEIPYSYSGAPNVYIHSNSYTWTFGTDGNLITPGQAGTYIKSASGGYMGLAAIDDGGDQPAQLVSINANTDLGTTAISAYANNATIQANINGDMKTWTFDNTGNLQVPGDVFANGIASPAPALYGFSSLQVYDQINVGGIVITSSDGSNGQVLTTYGNGVTYWSTVSGGSGATGATGPQGDAGATGLTGLTGATGVLGTASNVDITNTNGLTTPYYITFVEDRTTAQIVRADVDLSYRTDTNTLTVGNISANGNVTANNFSGNITITGNVTGTSPNVTLVAGSYSYTFDNTGNIALGNGTVTLGNVTGNTNGFAIGYRDIPQVVASNTTLALTDAGKHYYSTTAGNLTITIPANNSVAFNTGAAITIVVQAAGNVLVNAAAGVTLYMASNSTAGNRVVGSYGMATLLKVAANTWFINGTGVS